jgi:catechol 2,3-dioxygenase-like lactoylglutathione lyase family enzyme
MLADSRVAAMLPVQDISRARRFYEGTLGLRPYREAPDGVLYELAGGTRLGLFQRPPVHVEHTQAAFEVPDVASMVRDLRAKGVKFEEYNTPEIKTTDGINERGGVRGAWFKDPDGNILGVMQFVGMGGLQTNR